MAYRRIGKDRRFERVSASLELLPSSPGGASDTSSFVRGSMEFFIASRPEVRREIQEEADKAYTRSQVMLAVVRAKLGTLGKRFEQGVRVDKQRGRLDAYLVLTDENSGTPGAMAIEFGRDEYYVTFDERDSFREEGAGGETYRVGEMEGVGILHSGFGLPPYALDGTGGGDIP